MDHPTAFRTMRAAADTDRPIVVRQNLEDGVVAELLGEVAAVEWSGVHHAYGPATDVPGQLAAVIVGDDATREEAWWNLWGNIHHQGTIYEATVPAVPILLGVATWPAHPDRAQAILLLREVGAAEGGPVALLAAGTAPMLDGWRSEPSDVQRALLWLLTVHADLRAWHQDLVEEVLPKRHRQAWELAIAGSVNAEEEADAVFALEDWVHSGADG